MIQEIKNNPKRYGRFFLSMEADGEEDLNNDENIHYNTKIITVKPRNTSNRFTKLGNEFIMSDDEINALDDNQEEPTDDSIDQNVENPEEVPDDNTEPIVNDNSEYQDDNSSEPVIQDDLVDSIQADNEELGIGNTDPTVVDNDIPSDDMNPEINTDEPVIDDTSFDQGEVPPEEGVPNEGEVPPEDPNAQQQKRGPGIEYDSTRKYVLFKKFIDLSSAIQDYIDDLSDLTNDDFNTNQIYKIAINKLTDIYDVTYDYMTMRFELSSYVQSLLFYQERIVSVYKVFDLINYGLESLNKKTKK